MADIGQFITHDIMQTPDMAGGGPDPCNCIRDDVCVNIRLDNDPIIKAGAIFEFFVNLPQSNSLIF